MNNGENSSAHVVAKEFSVFYGDTEAVKKINLEIPAGKVTAIIGPSGCGKSTFLRAINRMNDLIPGARLEGSIRVDGHDIYGDSDPVMVRRYIGMVFQKPNPFPKSIFDNVAWGAKINGFKGSKSELTDLVERALRQAALWDEVVDAALAVFARGVEIGAAAGLILALIAIVPTLAAAEPTSEVDIANDNLLKQLTILIFILFLYLFKFLSVNHRHLQNRTCTGRA